MKASVIGQCLMAPMSGPLDLTGKCSHYNKALLQGYGDEGGRKHYHPYPEEKQQKKIGYKFSYVQS